MMKSDAIKLATLEHYSVQLLLDDGTVDNDGAHTVEANSPLAAGEEATGVPLSLHGSRPRAIVRWMSSAYVAFMVTLYDPQAPPPGSPLST
jgi:hypothetical protein